MLSANQRSQLDNGPTGVEWWLGYAALLVTVLVPALAKALDVDATASSPLGEILWSVIYVLAAIRLFALRDAAAGLLRGSVVLLAFVFLMVLSTLWSVNSAVTLKNSLELAGTTLIAYYLVARYPLPRLLDLFGLAFGTIGAACLIAIVFFPGHSRMDWGTGAFSGLFQDKNLLGAAMVLAIITLAVTLWTGSGRRRWLTFVALCLCIGLLAGSRSVTASASGIAALTLGFGAWFWSRSRAFGRFIVAAIVAATVASGLVLGFRPDAAFDVLGRSSSLTGRTDFWPYLVAAIGDRPLLGYGYNAFFPSSVGNDYLSYYVVEAGGWVPYHAHDSFLQIGLDAGFVGLVLLVALLLVALVGGLRYPVVERGLIAAWPLMIVLYLVFGSYTETYLGNFNSFEWIFFVVASLYPIANLHRPRAEAGNYRDAADAGELAAIRSRSFRRPRVTTASASARSSPSLIDDDALGHAEEAFVVD